MKRNPLFLATLVLASPAFAQNMSLTLTNGVNGGAEIPYSAQVVPQSGITVEAWITYDGATLIPGWAHPTLFRQNLTSGQESFFVRINAGNSGARRLSWAIRTQSGTLNWVNWDFAVGQFLTWTHVAATYDGTTQRLFVNGAEVNSMPLSDGALKDSGGLLHIGKGDPGSTNSYYEVWNGQIDELRMWPFARTEGEIRSTMNMELSSVPGLVSTWSFNASDFQDGSSTLHGTSVGTVNFTSNAPVLQTVPHPGVSPTGASSPGCLGAIEATVASLPQAGNLDFAFVAHRFPAGAPVAMIFGSQMASTPLQIAGIDVWVDLFGPLVLMATVSNDALGTARFNLPIPSWVGSGALFGAQFLAVDPCGAAGLTASDGLAGIVLP